MRKNNEFGAVMDLLSTTSNNSFVFSADLGNWQINYIIAGCTTVTPSGVSDVKASMRHNRIIVISSIGAIPENAQIDSWLNASYVRNDYSEIGDGTSKLADPLFNQGIKVLLDVFYSPYEQSLILPNLNIDSEPGKTLSVFQTNAYSTTETSGAPSTKRGTLTVLGTYRATQSENEVYSGVAPLNKIGWSY